MNSCFFEKLETVQTPRIQRCTGFPGSLIVWSGWMLYMDCVLARIHNSWVNIMLGGQPPRLNYVLLSGFPDRWCGTGTIMRLEPVGHNYGVSKVKINSKFIDWFTTWNEPNFDAHPNYYKTTCVCAQIYIYVYYICTVSIWTQIYIYICSTLSIYTSLLEPLWTHWNWRAYISYISVNSYQILVIYHRNGKPPSCRCVAIRVFMFCVLGCLSLSLEYKHFNNND